MTEKDLQHSIDELVRSQRAAVRISNQFWRPLVNGALYSIGASVGVAIVLTITAAGLKQAEVIPVIGRWLAQLTPFVQHALQR